MTLKDALLASKLGGSSGGSGGGDNPLTVFFNWENNEAESPTPDKDWDEVHAAILNNRPILAYEQFEGETTSAYTLDSTVSESMTFIRQWISEYNANQININVCTITYNSDGTVNYNELHRVASAT